MRRTAAGFVIFLAIAIVGLIPLVSATSGERLPWLSDHLVAAFNLLGWSTALALLFSRRELRIALSRLSEKLGLERRGRSTETLLGEIVGEIERKNSALAVNITEQKVSTKEDLSVTLERIVGLSYRLLHAESAELTLFDREAGLYHSSFVLGRPFSVEAQAMLSDAVKGEQVPSDPDVLIQPISFAGTTLGTLRVGLKRGTLPSGGDRQILKLLALQGSMAIINAQYTTELVRMKQASEESVKAKTGFLANLSHELRGPLGIMLNAVELVLDGLCGPINNDQLETLKMVHSNGEHLLELINDVLDYAKVESGKLVPQRAEILVDDLLRDITEVVRTQAEAKSHRLVFLPSNDTLVISCDRRHIRQMMINLLTNAIKYTQDGGHVEVWAERAPGYKIKLNVKDSGVGIAAADRDKVFAAFERIDSGYSHNQVGTGLGMPLTKRLAEVNGGSIDFTSVPSEGSHFWLSFPAVELTSSIISEQDSYDSAKLNEPLGRGEMVLLVEKDEGDRNMLAHYLKHVGFKILTAGSKDEAIDCLRKTDVSLAILDNNIADNPSEDIISVIRDASRSSTFPLVLLSSRAFVFDIEKYLKLGVDRCLTKPIQLKVLGQICRDLIDSSLAAGAPAEGEQAAVKEDEEEKGATGLLSGKALGADDIVH